MTNRYSTLTQITNVTQQFKQQQHSQQFYSARQIRPSLFLNEVDFHLPIITSPQQRLATEEYPRRITSPKSLAVSPEYRKTQPDQEEAQRIYLPQNYVRSFRKQRLFIKNQYNSNQVLNTFQDAQNNRPEFLTPDTKATTYSRLGSQAQTFRSAIFQAGESILKEQATTDLNLNEKKSHQNIKAESNPQLTSIESPPTINTTKPHHKKAVSFRNSITVVDIQNGVISKDKLNQGEKHLTIHHQTHQPTITEEDATAEFLKQLHPGLLQLKRRNQ